jgi:HlyD family secretion protein
MRMTTKLLLLSCLLAGAFFAYSKGYIPMEVFRRAPQKTFQTEPVQRRTILRKKVFSGNLTPRKEIKVEAHITGVVEKLLVQPGDCVQPGKDLARIAIQPDAQAVEKAKHELQLASIALKQTRTSHMRNKQLFAKKMLAKSDYETTLADFEKAKQNFETAQKQVQIVQHGYIKGNNINGNLIKATSKGTILELPVKEGGAVKGVSNQASGTVVAVIADMDDFLFKAYVSELDVVHLSKGMSFDIALNADNKKKFRVVLTKIAPKASEKVLEKGEVKFEIEGLIKSPKSAKKFLRVGYLALAEVTVQKATNVLAVPEKYIQSEGKDYFVWCLEAGQKVKKNVVLGLSDGLYAEAKKGLNEKDQLIVEE